LDRSKKFARTVLSDKEQEAQLSQGDHAMLRITEYFVKSCKFIRNDILEKVVTLY